MSSRTLGDLPEIGSLLSEDKLSGYFDVELSREPVNLTERLVFLGEIERTNEFEAKNPIGRILDSGVEKDDFIVDDSALAYKSPVGLVIITGCSHAGICNIIEYARKVCNDGRVVDIVGGFHLLDPSVEQLEGTIKYMESLGPGSVHACHCTDLNSKIALSRVVDLKEVGGGITLKYWGWKLSRHGGCSRRQEYMRLSRSSRRDRCAATAAELSVIFSKKSA